MNFNKLADAHYDWVERMGWHNKTILESIALIQSEVGEAIDEFIGKQDPTEHFGEELADICLRMFDVGKTYNIDTEKSIKEAKIGWRSVSIEGDFCEVILDLAKWTNTVRKEVFDDSFYTMYGEILARVVDIAERNYVNLTEEIIKKLEKNEIRGTRGRRV